jgi:hypothetical protein
MRLGSRSNTGEWGTPWEGGPPGPRRPPWSGSFALLPHRTRLKLNGIAPGPRPGRRWAGAVLAAMLLVTGVPSAAEPVAVRETEGLVRGFLVLRTLEGETLAGGTLRQVSRKGQVTSQVAFQFHDGSLHEETAVFTQRRQFRLVSYRLVQKGPAFDTPMDVSIDAPAGRVKVRYTDEDGEEQVATEKMDLPEDLANGLVFTLLKNIDPEAPETTVSMLGMTPQPRLVKLKIAPAGEEQFSAGGVAQRAIHYVVKVEIGGLTGLVATLLGKNPPDHHVWIAGGEAPGFVKAEGPLYLGGPAWRIELASPRWRDGGSREE